MKRTYLASSLILTVSAVAFSMQGCNPGQTLAPLPAGGGDDNVGGDMSGNGGGGGTTGGTAATSNGGGNSNGGTATGSTTGGTSSVPGATGGKAGTTGGSPPGATGGAKPTGGTNSVTPATGGMVAVATGGMVTVATGGMVAVATGGSPVVAATGGATAAGNSGKTVTFSPSGKASGAMSGWAFVALGATDTVSVPTCGSPAVAITGAAQCTTSTNWPTAGICVTGSVPPNPSPYTSWGINIGVDSTDPAGGGLGQTFSSVTIAATGVPAGATFRYIIALGTGTSEVDYCAAATPGTAVSFSTFNTKCYDTPIDGTAYAGNGSDITGVQLQVVPGSATITVTSLCITGITFS